MPVFLNVLGVIGTAAMIWVGGGIIVHGLEGYGMASISGAIHRSAELAAHAIPLAAGVTEWLITAIGSGLVGLIIGSVLIPLTEYVIAAWKAAQDRDAQE
jgi:predicted DNA repair protein MutK